MKEPVKQSRRTAIKTGLGVAGVASLAGIGFSWPVKALEPAAVKTQRQFSGLKPLYSSSSKGQQAGTSSAALSATPDENVTKGVIFFALLSSERGKGQAGLCDGRFATDDKSHQPGGLPQTTGATKRKETKKDR